MAVLKGNGAKSATLYAASNTMSRALEAHGKSDNPPIGQLVFRKGKWEVDGIRVPNRPEDIRKAYKRFESVVHILAANAVVGSVFEPQLAFEPNDDKLYHTLHTAGSLEHFLLEHYPEHFKNPWSVIQALPDQTFKYDVVPVLGPLRAFIEAGIEA